MVFLDSMADNLPVNFVFFHLLVTSWTRGPHFLSLHLNVLLDSRQEICRTLVMEGNIFARPCERMSA